MTSGDTQLVFSQEAVPPVTMADIVAKEGPSNLVVVKTPGAEKEDKIGTGTKIGIAGVLLAAIGVFAGNRNKGKSKGAKKRGKKR